MPCGFRSAFFISIGRKVSCMPVSAKSYICKFELLSFLVDIFEGYCMSSRALLLFTNVTPVNTNTAAMIFCHVSLSIWSAMLTNAAINGCIYAYMLTTVGRRLF